MPTVKLVLENTTDPRIRAVFEDIKARRKIERIPNIWRALAANPEHLESCFVIRIYTYKGPDTFRTFR